MLTRILMVSLALLIVLAASAQQDADRVLLRYQWNAGDEITWQVTSETTGTVLVRDRTKDPVEEQTQDIWTSTSVPLTLAVESVDADGNGTVSYRMGVMEMDMTMQGQQMYMRIDPEAGTMTVNGEEQPLPGPMMGAMLQDMTMVISPRGEMLEVQLPEGAPFGGMFPGFDMTQMMRMGQQWQATFHEQPIPVAYSWGSSMPMPFGGRAEAGAAAAEEGAPADGEAPGEVPAATMVFTLAGWETVGEAQCARIDMVGAMDIDELPMPMGAMGMGAGAPEGMQMKLGPMHISIDGSMLFDPAAGKVLSMQMGMLMDLDQRIAGTVETPGGQQAMDMEILIRDLLTDVTMEPQ